jgi:DUF2911 family protein
MKNLLMAGLLLLASQFDMSAQKNEAPKSPKATAEGKDVSVKYGQPSKRGRVIFGELVPYGEVWRTGANEATEITFKKDVMIDNKEVKAGTYTLFSIPQKDKWTIILNSELKQWGAYEYDKIKGKDVLKTDLPIRKVPVQEKLTYNVKDSGNGAVLTITWDEVAVDLTIKNK